MRRFGWAVVAVLMAGAAAADPVEGRWNTLPDDNGNYGQVEILACGAKFCGTLVAAFDPAGTRLDSPNVGKQMIWDMEALGDGSYGNGQIWAPDRDKTYASRMELSGDVLSVSGCVLGGLICRAQDWTRAK